MDKGNITITTNALEEIEELRKKVRQLERRITELENKKNKQIKVDTLPIDTATSTRDILPILLKRVDSMLSHHTPFALVLQDEDGIFGVSGNVSKDEMESFIIEALDTVRDPQTIDTLDKEVEN